MVYIRMFFQWRKIALFLMNLKKLLPAVRQEILETKSMFVFLVFGVGSAMDAKKQAIDLIRMIVFLAIFAIPFIGGTLSVWLASKSQVLKPSAFR